jgi:alpha-tubulin suppressor-like RCC1 family protein
MWRGHGIKGGSVARFLLTMLMVAGIVVCSVIVFAVRPARADLTLASTPLVNTLQATGISATTATLNGEIASLGGRAFVAVSAGYGHSLGVCSDGTLWAWGYNAYGQLGLGDITNRLSPTQVGSDTDWVAVAAGESHSLGVRSDGTLWSWGRNTLVTPESIGKPAVTSYGQLGLGDTANRLSPAPVGSGTNWVAVAAGGGHSLGVRSDGTLWAWGRNYFGQLGLGDTANRLSPAPVGSGTNWVAMSAGYEHSLGVRSDGTLWAWGWNPHGELGLGNIGQEGKKSPTQVGNATDWVAASGAMYTSVGVRSDGTLWSWGMTYYASGGSIWTPTQVGSATNWAAVADGASGSLGMRSDGTLWVWPHNAGAIPSQVTMATNWARVSARFHHYVGLRSDGTLWAWGSNPYGQLGVGDTTDRSSPTQPILDRPSCQVSLQWGPTASYGYETTPQTMTGPGAFSADISGLSPAATYHYRAKAVGEVTSYGNDMTFTATSAPSAPSVTTSDASSITTSSARLNGDLTSPGMALSVQTCFEWGPTTSYGYETTLQTMTGTGTFTASISGLTPETTYYFRAKAVGDGTGYGAERSFATVREAASRLPLWVYPVAIVGGLMVLMALVAIGARVVRRLVG